MAVKTKLYTGETVSLMLLSAALGAGAMWIYYRQKNGLNDFNTQGGIYLPGPPPKIPGTQPPNFDYGPFIFGKKSKLPPPGDLDNNPYKDLEYPQNPAPEKTGGVNR